MHSTGLGNNNVLPTVSVKLTTNYLRPRNGPILIMTARFPFYLTRLLAAPLSLCGGGLCLLGGCETKELGQECILRCIFLSAVAFSSTYCPSL